MGTSRRIALVFDCDGTIAEDTTSRVLLTVGIDPGRFWRQVRALEGGGWDPALAYMTLLARTASARRPPLTKRSLRRAGRAVEFSRGIPAFFGQVRRYVKRNYGDEGISLSIYIVSSGFEEVIAASRIGREVDGIFAARFAYDERGVVTDPASTVSFTEKTKFLFAINKGLSPDEVRDDPYLVNAQVAQDDRAIPFTNMIYIGDGPTDVPCMSLLKREGATIFAVYTEPRQGIPKSTYNLARDGRFTRGPFRRDYRPRSDLRRALESEIDGYAERILGELHARRRQPPRH